MEHKEVTATKVEAQPSCAYSTLNSFTGIGTVEQQPHFTPVTRRALMAAVNTTSRMLGLRPSSVVVLDALVSCLPCSDPKTGSDAPITPLTLLTVFACNDTLCFRAKGITDRQLRRHLEKLEAANLIQRRDSANGKRFPIMRNGKVIGAFGIDLAPLLVRSGEILALSLKLRQQAEELRGMKAHIQKLRARCLGLELRDEALEFVEAVRNTIRRAGITLLQARSIISTLTAIIQTEELAPVPSTTEEFPVVNTTECEYIHPDAQAHHTNEMTASDGQNDRHKETQKSYTIKTSAANIAEIWASLSEIPAYYPEQPSSEHGLLQLMFDFGRMLRIDSILLSEAIATRGVHSVMRSIDQIAAKIDKVRNPERYFTSILANT